ncbi:MAG TPA: hypothetical protein VNX86_08915 [Rhizomicrobium sp.]|jgi:hypothetical protein|nr:hypothetical protein [Rhizomicrobium sp.]
MNLSWQAKDVLRIFRELGMEPGQHVGYNHLWHKLASVIMVADGVKALAENGFVIQHADDAELTDKGYELIRIA